MGWKFEDLLRPNIRILTPYSSARSEFSGSAAVFMDANENPLGSASGLPYSRYPDPLHWKLRLRLAELKGVDPEWIALGNGSDELMDLLVRSVAVPGNDAILITPPTFGMYQAVAGVNDVRVVEAALGDRFELQPSRVLEMIDPSVKIIFLCSPNNPTGNVLSAEGIRVIAENFTGLVVVDEAYIDFCASASIVPQLASLPNVAVLQTLSKAWGLAALRVGVLIADPQIIHVIEKIKLPYNLSLAAQRDALVALGDVQFLRDTVTKISAQREYLRERLSEIGCVRRVYSSETNFLLVEFSDPQLVCASLREKGIIVRDRSKLVGCEGCVRISVGTESENELLLAELRLIE